MTVVSFNQLADVVASYDPKPGLHYHLSCYVCGRACAHPSPFEGWATFATIFSRRPDGCRFAIAKQIVLKSVGTGVASTVQSLPDDTWVCWDLLDDGLIDRSSRASAMLHPPLPMWTSAVEEALIMKAMMLYDRP